MNTNEPLKIFIGYDPREAVVYHTLQALSKIQISCINPPFTSRYV